MHVSRFNQRYFVDSANSSCFDSNRHVLSDEDVEAQNGFLFLTAMKVSVMVCGRHSCKGEMNPGSLNLLDYEPQPSPLNLFSSSSRLIE